MRGEPGRGTAAVALAAGAAIIVLALVGWIWISRVTHDARIVRGVYIGPWNVGGLVPSDAIARIEAGAQRMRMEPVYIRYQDRTWVYSPDQVGIRVNSGAAVKLALSVARKGPWWRRARERREIGRNPLVLPVPCMIDSERFAAYIAALGQEIDRPAANARVVRDASGSVSITPHQVGRQVRASELVDLVKQAAWRESSRRIILPVDETDPDVTTAELARGDFRALLARYSTRFDPANVDRVHNVRTAAEGFAGILLRPGDIISFNDIVGPRIAEKGYRMAPTIVGDELVPDLGGGVCQVSSTLYNVVLLADLRILRHTSHSRPVPYAPLGRDATVLDNQIDFRFMNDTVYPMYLTASVSGNTLSISLFGPLRAGRSVRVSTRILEEIPFNELEEVDPGLKPGQKVLIRQGSAGYRVELWREVLEGADVVKKELVEIIKYRPLAGLTKVGPSR